MVSDIITDEQDRQSEARALFKQYLERSGLPTFPLDKIARALIKASDSGALLPLEPDARQMLVDVIGEGQA